MSRRNPSAPVAPLVALTLLAVAASPKPASGQVLYERQLLFDHNSSSTPPTPVIGPLEFDWSFIASAVSLFPPQPVLPTDGRVFDAFKFSPTTVGQTFRVLPGDDPDFATLEGLLTNGQEDYLYRAIQYRDRGRAQFQNVGSSLAGSRERFWLFNRTDGEPFDLAGYDITAFALRHDSLSVVNDGSSLRINGAITLTIEGTAVPEPAGVAVGLAGAGWWILKRRRRTDAGTAMS